VTERVGPPIKVEQHDVGRADREVARQAKEKHTLLDMASEYEFFTTALVNIAGNFDRDPVIEFNKYHPTSVPGELPFAIDCKQPFFKGLGTGLLVGHPVNWDRRIYGIVRERWDLCRDTIGGIALMGKAGFYARVCFYELRMLDPTSMAQNKFLSELPIITVTVFAVSSNRNFSHILPAVDVHSLPSLQVDDPLPDIMIEGKQVTGPPPKPEHLLPRKTELPRSRDEDHD
jgi:hypothetical protein